MAAHLFNESGQMQEVDIPDIFDVLAGGEDESAVKLLLGFSAEDEAAVALMADGGGGLTITPDSANTYLSGNQLITSGIGTGNFSGISFPHQVSLREFLTSSPGPISPSPTTPTSLPSLITSSTTLMTASTMLRNTSSPLNTVLTKAMSNVSSPAIALSPPLSSTSDLTNETKQTKLIVVEPQTEQNSTLQYLQSPVEASSSEPSSNSSKQVNTRSISTIATIQKSDTSKAVTGTLTTTTSVIDSDPRTVSLTAAGTPRKRDPVDPSRCIYPCDCCGKAFTTKFNLKRHINMHCSPSKEAGVPLQGPPSASQPSRKSREKREAKLAATASEETSNSLQGFNASRNTNAGSQESISSLSGSKKSKRTKQTKRRYHSTEVNLSTSNDQSPPLNTTSNVKTLVTGSATLSSITNSNSPVVIQSNVAPNTTIIQAPTKNKNLSISSGGASGIITIEGKNKQQQQGSIHVVQPKTITYQLGPSSDGTLQFTLATPTQQTSLHPPPQIRSVTQSMNKGGSSILPVSISTETTRLPQGLTQQETFHPSIGTVISRDTELTKYMPLSLPPHTIAQLTQPLTSVVTTPTIRDLIEKHRPNISATSTSSSSVIPSQQQPSIFTMSNSQSTSDTVAVQMIQNLTPVEVFGNRRGTLNSQQPPRIVRLIHHPVPSTTGPNTYLTPSSSCTSIIKPQHIIQQSHQQITLQPPPSQISTTMTNVPLIQLPPLTVQHQTIPTASLTMAPQTIQFPQQPIPLVQALSSAMGSENNLAPTTKQILLSNSSSATGHTNLTDILPQAISRFIAGAEGNLTVQQTSNNSNTTLPTGTVLAVRTAPTTSAEQITLPSIPAESIAKICHTITHGGNSQIGNVVPTSISILSGAASSLQHEPAINYVLPQSTISNSFQPSVSCVEKSPIVFGNTPPAEIFDSDDGEAGSSIATNDMPSPPPTSTYHPTTWANSNLESAATIIPTTQHDPFLGDSQVSAIKSQPIKHENSHSSTLIPTGLFPGTNANSQVVISLQNNGVVHGAVGGSSSGIKSLTATEMSRCGVVIKQIVAPVPQSVQLTPVIGSQEVKDQEEEEEEDYSESEYDDNDDDEDDDVISNAASLLPSNQFHGQLLAIPNGWLRKVVATGSGAQQQQKVFYYNQVGKRFSNQDEIDQYFAKLGYSVGLSLFNFDHPPQQKNNPVITVKQHSVIPEDLNVKNKKRAAQTRPLPNGKKMNSIASENIEGASNKNSVAQKTKSSGREFTKYPPTKKPKILGNTPSVERNPSERNLHMKGLSKNNSSPSSEEKQNLFVAIKTDPFASSSILETNDINGDQSLEPNEYNDNDDEDDFELALKGTLVQPGSDEIEMSSPPSDDLEQQSSNNTMTTFLKKCDTTSSPTSSTPIPGPTTPPLILSNSTTHQEIVYNNNGYSIKSSISDFTNYNIGTNGSSKEESVTSTCSPPPSQIEINAADGSFTEVGTITTTSGFASVSSTSTLVSLESSTLSNGPSSF